MIWKDPRKPNLIPPMDIGRIYDFRVLLKDERTGNLEECHFRVAAKNFNQALDNLQEQFPPLEQVIDEMRIKVAGEGLPKC